MITVFIVDDSSLMHNALKKILDPEPDIKIIGTASNGREALEKIPGLKPRVVLTDLRMPVMDGFELVKELMQSHPVPILVVSAVVTPDITQGETFRILEMGAMDILPKPGMGTEEENRIWKRQLINKIKVLSGVMPITRRLASGRSFQAPASLKTPPVIPDASVQEIVCIGASTGGPIALKEIFSSLPGSFAYPVCCAMHIYEGFTDELISWLKSYAHLKIVKAQNHHTPEPGYIYFPEDNTHLTFDGGGRFILTPSVSTDLHKPSVDLLFQTAARAFGPKLTAAILTGMGRDGAQGLLEIKNAGGLTMAQNEASCVVFGMPKEAIQLGAAQHVLSISQIISQLLLLG